MTLPSLEAPYQGNTSKGDIPKAGGAHPILALREGSLERTGIIFASPGADIAKIASRGPANGPVLGLGLEQQLRAGEPLPTLPANHRFALTLTGDMASYTWQIDGGDSLNVKHGDRIEVSMQNMSMMAHPMHLHGHHFQVIGINGNTLQGAVRDTVLVPPMGSVVAAFDANNPGRWPLHCYHLYHMASGMMSFVAYRDGS